MTDAHAKAIRETQASVPTIRTGTVVTDYASITTTYVTLDNDPTSTPVRAMPMAGALLPVGTRVGLIAYPPRGLAIIGRLDGIDARTLRPKESEAGNALFSTVSAAFVALGALTTDVTIPYPASGILSVTFGGALSTSVAAQFSILSFEIRDTNVGGTLRLAASDDRSLFATITGSVSSQRTWIASGLPTTGNAFVRLMLRSTTATAPGATVNRPYTIVQPIA